MAGSVNLLMGFVEIIASFYSLSSSLFADSLDFFVDGINYFSSLIILKKSKEIHERAGFLKGYIMILFGLGIFVWSVFKYLHGWVPRGEIMTNISLLALIVNLFSTWILQKFQNDSLDLRAVWLCTRNDALGNMLIMIAGYLTLYFSSPFPDIFVSLFMGIVIVRSGFDIIKS